jgi:hypothetical protein
MDTGGRAYCADEPDGIRHLVDSPRAARCDQHRLQRHRWSDANAHRRRAGKPPKKWVPEPLTFDRRREALLLHTDTHAQLITRALRRIRQSVDDLDGNLTPALGGEQFRLLVKNLETIRTQCGNLEVVSERMGLT